MNRKNISKDFLVLSDEWKALNLKEYHGSLPLDLRIKLANVRLDMDRYYHSNKGTIDFKIAMSLLKQAKDIIESYIASGKKKEPLVDGNN